MVMNNGGVLTGGREDASDGGRDCSLEERGREERRERERGREERMG